VQAVRERPYGEPLFHENAQAAAGVHKPPCGPSPPPFVLGARDSRLWRKITTMVNRSSDLRRLSYQSAFSAPGFLGAARTAPWKQGGPRMADWYHTSFLIVRSGSFCSASIECDVSVSHESASFPGLVCLWPHTPRSGNIATGPLLL
jgi:hypothetical protein